MADRLTATQALEQIQAGSLSVEDLCRALLDRSARRSEVEAWTHLVEEEVLSEARRLDAVPKDQRGPLFGIPVAIKDLFYAKGARGAKF